MQVVKYIIRFFQTPLQIRWSRKQIILAISERIAHARFFLLAREIKTVACDHRLTTWAVL
jgi:hypothetical protein